MLRRWEARPPEVRRKRAIRKPVATAAAQEDLRLTARELLRLTDQIVKVAVAQAVGELLDPLSRRIGITRDDVLVLLVQLVGGLMQSLGDAADAVGDAMLLVFERGAGTSAGGADQPVAFGLRLLLRLIDGARNAVADRSRA